MKLTIKCRDCKLNGIEHLANIESYDNHLIAVAKCNNGHEFKVSLDSNKVEFFLDCAAEALSNNYPREACFNLSLVRENLFLFAIEVMLLNPMSLFVEVHQNNKEKIDSKMDELIENKLGLSECARQVELNRFFQEEYSNYGHLSPESKDFLKTIQNQSERIIGAFSTLYFIHFQEVFKFDKRLPNTKNDIIKFRNDIIHKGEIPTLDWAFSYADVVYQETVAVMNKLKIKFRAQLEKYDMVRDAFISTQISNYTKYNCAQIYNRNSTKDFSKFTFKDRYNEIYR